MERYNRFEIKIMTKRIICILVIVPILLSLVCCSVNVTKKDILGMWYCEDDPYSSEEHWFYADGKYKYISVFTTDVSGYESSFIGTWEMNEPNTIEIHLMDCYVGGKQIEPYTGCKITLEIRHKAKNKIKLKWIKEGEFIESKTLEKFAID